MITDSFIFDAFDNQNYINNITFNNFLWDSNENMVASNFKYIIKYR